MDQFRHYRRLFCGVSPRSGKVLHLRRSEGGGRASLIPLERPRAHEVGAWATALAAAHSTRMKELIRAAYWRSPYVFIDFYLRDISCTRLDGLYSISLRPVSVWEFEVGLWEMFPFIQSALLLCSVFRHMLVYGKRCN